MKPHPLSEIFPPLEGAEFDALVADIEKRGLVQPVVMYQGKILDGRNRWRACEKLGIKPKTVDYRGDDPVGHVLSLNLSRRHLSESQRAMVAAKLSTLSHGGDRKSENQDANLHLETTTKTAAKALNVSPRTAASARAVLSEGTPALARAVERNEIPVSIAAKVAEASPAKQREAVKGGKAIAREIAREVVAEKRAEKAEKIEPEEPPIRTLGLKVSQELLARATKEQGLLDKMSALLAELKRTFTEYEGIKSVVGKLGGGKHYASAFRSALEELNLLRRQRPASVCPHCKMLDELQPTCAVCRASGYIGEEALKTVEKTLLATGDDAGVWVRGTWRTLASIRGDDF